MAILDREERQTVYSVLGLRMEAVINKSSKVRGVFGEETLVWGRERTSRRSFPEANSPSDKTFGFALILREDEPPETALRVLGGT
ncbi:MAG: hypothetical protein WKF67_07300 [Rubrobacteraceae bacterium]